MSASLHISDNEFKIGKTDNLKILFGNYNRLTKTVLIYYRDCGSKTDMDCSEVIIFNHLDQYRRYQNGEKFILNDKDFPFFISTIDNIINFITTVEGQGDTHLDMIDELNSEDGFEFDAEEPVKSEINKNFIKQIDKRVQILEEENQRLRVENARLVSKIQDLNDGIRSIG